MTPQQWEHYKSYIKPQLVYRFVNDFYMPFNCTFKQELFAYDLLYFEKTHGSLLKWCTVCDTIRDEFNDNIEEFVAAYCAVRDKIITDISASEKFQKFNTEPVVVDFYKSIVYPKTRYNSIYNQETCKSGKSYWSFDMKNANYQVLKFWGCIPDDIATYNELIAKYCSGGLYDYITSSKYFRQVVFGKLNPGRTTKCEKAYMYYILENSIKPVMGDDVECLVFNSDEFIIEAGTEEQKESIMKSLSENFFDIRLEEFTVNGYEYYASEEDHEPRKIGEFYHRSCDSLNKLRCVNSMFLKPVMNAYLGVKSTIEDKTIVYDKCTAVLNEDITIKQIK